MAALLLLITKQGDRIPASCHSSLQMSSTRGDDHDNDGDVVVIDVDASNLSSAEPNAVAAGRLKAPYTSASVGRMRTDGQLVLYEVGRRGQPRTLIRACFRDIPFAFLWLSRRRNMSQRQAGCCLPGLLPNSRA